MQARFLIEVYAVAWLTGSTSYRTGRSRHKKSFQVQTLLFHFTCTTAVIK